MQDFETIKINSSFNSQSFLMKQNKVLKTLVQLIYNDKKIEMF